MQCTKDGFFNRLNIQDSMGGWGKVACDIFENIGVWAPLVFVVWELYQWYTSGACVHSVVKAYANRSSDDRQEVFAALTKVKGNQAREVIFANLSDAERQRERQRQETKRANVEAKARALVPYDKTTVNTMNAEAEAASVEWDRRWVRGEKDR